MGAIVSESQLKCIDEFVEEARAEGAEIYQANCPTPECGLYYPPTLVTNVQTVSKIVREEVFLLGCRLRQCFSTAGPRQLSGHSTKSISILF